MFKRLMVSCAAAAAASLSFAQHSVYVAPSGSDSTGDGSQASPFRSITKALSANTAYPDLEVNVEAGLYDGANGESFPISPAAGQSILGTRGGDPASVAGSTVIDAGGAAYAIQLPNQSVPSVLSGVAVTNALCAIHAIAWRGEINDVLVTDVAPGETYSMVIYGDNATHEIAFNRLYAVGIRNPNTQSGLGGRHLTFFLAGGGTLRYSDCVFRDIVGGIIEWGFFHAGWHGGSSWDMTIERSLFAEISYSGGDNNERGMIQLWGGGSHLLFDRNVVRDISGAKPVINENRTGSSVIANSLFLDLSTGAWPAIHSCYGGGTHVINSTFHNCSTITRVDNSVDHIYFYNCSVSHDTAGACALNSANDAGYANKLRLHNCNLWNVGSLTYDAIESAGVTQLDPLYADAANENFRLQITSPLVDAGDNSAVTADAFSWAMPITHDHLGGNRVEDGLGSGTPTVDIGAFEFLYGATTEPTFLTDRPVTHLFEGTSANIPVFVGPAAASTVTASVTYGSPLVSGPASITIAPGATNQLSLTVSALTENIDTWIRLDDTASPATVASGSIALALHPKKVAISAAPTTFLASNAVHDVSISLPGTSVAVTDLPLSWSITSGAANNTVEWVGTTPAAIPAGSNAANGILRVTASSGATEVTLTVGGGYVFDATGTATATLTFIAHPGYLYVSPTGSDITGDGSLANPMLTLSTASAALADGQEIRLLPGTYDASTQTFPIALKSLTIAGAGATPADVVVDGGASANRLFDSRSANVVFRGLTFTRSTDTAVYAENSTVRAENCVFRNLSGAYTVGNDNGNATGIALVNASRGEVIDCLFENNVGRGDVGCERRDNYNGMGVTASNCVFRGNNYSIAALYARHHVAGCYVRAYDCVFTNNTAQTGGVDGGYGSIATYTTSATGSWVENTLRRCLIADNYGGEICGTGYSSVDIRDCLFANNETTAGLIGGQTYALNLVNSTFVHNSGSIACYSPNNATAVNVRNTIVADHLTAMLGNNTGTRPIFSNVLLWHGDGSYPAEPWAVADASSNVSTNNPKFVSLPDGTVARAAYDTASLNARFRSRNSPAFNAGDSSFTDSTLDLDRNPRILDGAIDLGCYEYQFGDVADPIFTTASADIDILAGSTLSIPVWIHPAAAYAVDGAVAYGTNLLSGAATLAIPADGTNLLAVTASGDVTEVVPTTITLTDPDGAVEDLVLHVEVCPKRVMLSAPVLSLMAADVTNNVAFSLPSSLLAASDIGISWMIVEGSGNNEVSWTPAATPAIEAGSHVANGELRVVAGAGKTIVRVSLDGGFVFDATGTASIDLAFIAHPGYLYVSPTGSDITGDGTVANPVQSIAMAMEGLADGQEVRLLPGTYDASTQTFPLVTRAISVVGCDAAGDPAPEFAVIDGGAAAAHLFTATGVDGAVFRDLVLRGATTSAIAASGSRIRVEGCAIRDNVATDESVLFNIGYAAGVSLAEASSGVFDGCVFERNRGRGAVGGDRHDTAFSNTSILATNCVFRFNTNTIASVYLRHHDASCRIDVVDCVFSNNATVRMQLDGSDACTGVFVTSANGARPSCSIRRSLFASNSGFHVIGYSYCDGEIRDSVFVDNECTSGGIVAGTYVVANCVNVTAANNPGPFLSHQLNPNTFIRNSVFVNCGPLFQNQSNTTPGVNNVMVWNASGAYPPSTTQYNDGVVRTFYDRFAAGASIVTNNPQFARLPEPFDAALFDGRPKNRKSPLLNAGGNDYVEAGATDFLGGPRILDGTVDIGAYESLRAALAGDGTILQIR